MMQICAHVAPGQAWAANDKEKVMFRRRRPLLRAAAVGGGAYLAGKHVANKRAEDAQMEAGQDDRINQLEQQQYQAPPPQVQQPPAAPQSSPMVDQLNQLADLHQRGVLTDDEFAAAKAKVFGT
jgi:Short C-terminal domain